MSNKAEILNRIAQTGVSHTVWEHAPAHTMEECYALPFASPEVTICKNILLCNRQKTQFYLYITPAGKPFRTADVSKLLGVSRLSFAPEDALQTLCQTESGSLAPFGLWYDQDHCITFVIDRDVMKTERIAFHPCDNSATVVFQQKDFWNQIVPLFPNTKIQLDVPMP